MNENELLRTIEEEMLFVLQKIDEFGEHKLQSGEISAEQYLSFSRYVRKYTDESRNILQVLNFDEVKKY
ncbi:MAG: hypothetical protein PHP42_09555 [Bacteroidota bacterium]|nr:hypothetical protein [Bacteroidota bacterium]